MRAAVNNVACVVAKKLGSQLKIKLSWLKEAAKCLNPFTPRRNQHINSPYNNFIGILFYRI